MKLTTFLVFVTFLISCSQNVQQDAEFSPIPIPQPTLTEREAKYIQEQKERLPKEIKIESKQFGMAGLEKENLPNDNLEIRLWRFSAFSDRDLVFILRQINNVWSANLAERRIAKKDIPKKNPPVKFFRKKLGQPKSGWESLWQKLIESEILTLPHGLEVDVIPFDDCWIFTVETKFENKYRVYDYFGPEVFEDIREARQMTKIIDTISEEFSLNDFHSDNFMKP
jgi:hypothetical protein